MVDFFAIRCIRMFSFFMRQPPFGLLGDAGSYYFAGGGEDGAWLPVVAAGDSGERGEGEDARRLVDGYHVDAAGVVVVPGGATAAVRDEGPVVGGRL